MRTLKRDKEPSFTSQWGFEDHDRHLTFCRLGPLRFPWNKNDQFINDYEEHLSGQVSFKVIGHKIFNRGKNHVLIVKFVDQEVEKRAKVIFEKYRTYERRGFIEDWNDKVLHLSFWEDVEKCHSYEVGQIIKSNSFRIKEEMRKDNFPYVVKH